MQFLNFKDILPEKELWGKLLLSFSAMLFFSELGESLWRTIGRYHLRRLEYLLVAFVLLSFVLLKKKFTSLDDTLKIWAQRAIFFVTTYHLYKQVRIPKILYHQNDLSWMGLRLSLVATLLVSLILLIDSYRLKIAQNKLILLLKAALALLFINKLLTLITSPTPHIDVFTSNTDAAQFLLQGLNPYKQTYKDIYSGLYDYAPGLVYWPGSLLWQSLSYFLVKDVRGIFIMSDLVSLFFILKILKQWGHDRFWSLSLSLLWFSFPIHNFVLEQGWVDPLLVSTVLAAFYFFKRQNMMLLGLALGMNASIKQYGIYCSFFMGLSLLNQKRFKDFLKLFLSAFMTFLLIMGPFLVSGFEEFRHMTVTVPLSQAFRWDSLNICALLFNEFKIMPGPKLFILGPILGMIFGLGFFIKNRHLPEVGVCGGLFFLYALTFLFGKQAFCNYYYFLAIFVWYLVMILFSHPPLSDHHHAS